MATKSKKGLGRGIDALLGGSHSMNALNEAHNAELDKNPAGQLTMLARDVLQAGKYQPRIAQQPQSRIGKYLPAARHV